MNRNNIVRLLLVLAAGWLESCQVIGGIFKAGVWVGILIVVAVIFIIVLIARGMSKK